MENDIEKIIRDEYLNNYLSIESIVGKYSLSKSFVRNVIGDDIRTSREIRMLPTNPFRRSVMSHPEKCFQKILEDNGIDKKCLIYREYSVFPYFIDFAFINEKIAVEIDGSQHLQEEYMKRDKLKDELLISKGWKVIRIAAIEVIRDGTKALKAINEALERKHTRWCNKSWDIKSAKNT